MFHKFTVSILLVAVALVQVKAQEHHTVTFVNDCGYGTPYLRAQSGAVLSTGSAYTSDSPLINATAYLQVGDCGNDGENCTVVVTTLMDGESTTEISLLPPHKFSVTTGWGYYNGCAGEGADCTSADCASAIHYPGQTFPQIICVADNVDLAITFCD